MPRSAYRLAVLSLAAVFLGAACERVQDANVGTLYTGPNQDVVKKLGDPDGSIYAQSQPQSGDPAMSPGFTVLSAVDFNLLTYAATRVFARDALGGGDVSRVRVYREIAAAPSEMVADFLAGPSSNPALAVLGGDLFVVWVGGPGQNRVSIRRSPNGTNWTDFATFDLPDPLTKIDVAPFGSNLLLAGFQNNSVVVYEIRMTSSPGYLERFVVAAAGSQMEGGSQVSLAVSGNTVLVVYATAPAQSVGDPCNLDQECRSGSCSSGSCVGTDPASGAYSGFLRMRGLSLDAGTRGQTSVLWSSGLLPVLRWASAARIVQASDTPMPNEYILAAFRGNDGSGDNVFICKWAWPTGTGPNWVLAPSDCSQPVMLNDLYLDANRREFELYADHYVRRRR